MNSDNFEGLCLIEIGGDSCANCIAVMPVLSELAAQFGLKFVKINIEDNPQSAAAFKIDRIPSIILADDGKPFAQCSGYQPQEILEMWIEAKLDDYKSEQNKGKQGE